MSVQYGQLLDATIAYLEQLKSQGTRYVSVSAETLAGLSRVPSAAPQPRATAAPVPSAQPGSTPAVRPAAQASTVAQTPLAPAAGQARTALSPEVKSAAMADLRKRALACIRCPNLVSSRKNVVFGVGDVHARIMFVGEAPGADEDTQGEPFVGAAGQLLTKIIQTMGLSRQSVYIANILKCRPDTPGQTSGNRKPTPEEMKTCVPYLQEQIDLIQPQVLVALGATAVEGLLNKPSYITKIRGQWNSYRGIPLMPTFHPSYLLRSESMLDKRRVWEDMLQVMEKVGLPISDKQRGYFLKG